MKQKIHLVGGCTSPYMIEDLPSNVSESAGENSETSTSKSSEATVLLEAFLATIIKVMGASAGIVRCLTPDGFQLKAIGQSGLPVEIFQLESEVDAKCGVCGKSTRTHAIESSDATHCKKPLGDPFFGSACNFVLAVPFESIAKEGEPAGVVTLFFASEQVITDDIRRTLQSYAELVRIGLKSIWQSEDNHQINLLTERQSIANEIHDSLAQTLYYAKMRANLLLDALKSDNDLLAYKCAQDIEESLVNSQKTVRELVTHFRCQMDPRGLQYAMQKLVKDFVTRTGIALNYQHPAEELNLPLEHELQVFLIVRESLVNIATHSGASVASVIVSRNDEQYQFTVEDNGEGVSVSPPTDGHYGLTIMRERALRIGGSVEVENLNGHGTRVKLIFNVPAA
jgi:two-component system, NarL family, nitrate/nitrite sensor histidine kinase NarX